MVAIRNLEVHVAHSCNLACESCTHYSNQNHKGLLDLDEAERWFMAWNRRVQPSVFSLLGGEPTVHPRLADFVTLSRRCWPEAQLRIVTNGFLLDRHPDLPKRMAEAGNARLFLSVHHSSQAYADRLAPVVALLRRWAGEHGTSISAYPSTKWWKRTYKGFGAEMEPFEDDQPRSSWENCMARYCPQIFEGKIWKCGPLAYLGMQHAKYGLSDKWRPYLAYRPLEPECSDDELAAFFAREEEAACRMCPAAPEHFELPLPFRSARVASRSSE
jgi:hypothetical protein